MKRGVLIGCGISDGAGPAFLVLDFVQANLWHYEIRG